MRAIGSLIKSGLKTGYRNLLSNFSVSFINIAGLSIGLTAVLMILLYVQDELSYDQWVPDHDRVYRIETTYYPPGRGVLEFAIATGPMQPLLMEDFPKLIEASTRIYRRGRTVKQADRSFNETINWVDKDFFTVIDLPIVAGSKEQALEDINAIAISAEMAQKYFGKDDPIGKTLSLNDSRDITVRAVFQSIPENSHLALDFITLLDRNSVENTAVFDQWTGVSTHLYVKTHTAEDAPLLEAELGDFFKRHSVSNIPSLKKAELDAITTMQLIPLSDIHFREGRRANMKAASSKTTVYAFALIAALILVIACINFMNLSTARSTRRAREIAMRKVLGGRRRQIMIQFLGETLLLILLSLSIALVVAALLMPAYNDYIGKNLSLLPLLSLSGLGTILTILAIVTLGGGLYPAVFLSSFKPARILSANKSSADSSSGFRNLLVFLQFAISITLMIATMVVYQQTNYAKTMDLGFNRDQMVSLSNMLQPQSRDKANSIKTEIDQLPGVVKSSFTNVLPPIIGSPNTIVTLPNAAPTDAALVIEQIMGDFDYFDTYGMQVVAGRGFSRDFPADELQRPQAENGQEGSNEDVTQSSIINESTVKLLGFSSNDEALGKIYYSNLDANTRIVSTIIGVVPDAHYHSIHTDLVPMLFILRTTPLPNLTVHLKQGMVAETLKQIDAIWAEQVPGTPINRTFMDEAFDAQYAGEEQRGEMFLYFALFAVFVACLGLYGLAAYNAERRTKEIGIHKTLGAEDGQIIRMLVLQFTKPVLLANAVAWPIAYIISNDWLNGFAYRVGIDPLLFLWAGIITLGIACLTVANHARRVSKTNPITALRHE